jgi:hypothetical protein
VKLNELLSKIIFDEFVILIKFDCVSEVTVELQPSIVILLQFSIFKIVEFPLTLCELNLSSTLLKLDNVIGSSTSLKKLIIFLPSDKHVTLTLGFKFYVFFPISSL